MDRTLLSILAGLGGMFGWGTSDFLANGASEKIGHSKTFLWSQLAGFTLLVGFLIFTAPSFAIAPYLIALTIIGGIAHGLGYLFFYKGFEVGNVSVVSAVVNLQVLFIMLISLFRGQTLTFLQGIAMLVLLAGVSLVSVNFADLKEGTVSLLKGVKETLFSTILFGVFYWPINEFVVEKTEWMPIVFITKLTAILVVFTISKLKRESILIPKISNKLAMLLIAVGLLEIGGILSVTYGQSFGDGIIVAPISSALTVVTVGLAMVFTKEKISKLQGLGIVLVVLGIVATAL